MNYITTATMGTEANGIAIAKGSRTLESAKAHAAQFQSLPGCTLVRIIANGRVIKEYLGGPRQP